ncbi:MAG: sigma 54-dependent Fis family transcriptional regulator [Deltaproteobacteria bacterium]|nr:sigma 54-dependent Fis family transcriptional regulator [Deltaproteobacteria bacterium]
MAGEASTLLVDRAGALACYRAPRFAVEMVKGPDAGLRADSTDGRLTVGTAEGVGLRLTDPTVSRFHAELEATVRGIALRDLGSTNGTWYGGVAVGEIVLHGEAELRFGRSRGRLLLPGEHAALEASGQSSFGELVGASPGMRRVYLLLERAAPTTAPVLITGESGTGKELAARAVHRASPRRSGPFEVVDCGGLPPTLIESELFGHERGAFTGAVQEREGAFERADGGTLFLDELGELPLELQPKLLRALGEREIRRLGAPRSRRVDVRVLAATNRDLRREVNAGSFRADLFYRLAVVQIELPPLRERIEDLPLVAGELVRRICAERELDAPAELDADLLDALSRHRWPGNVRELRNYLEQLLILRLAPELPGAEPGQAGGRSAPGDADFDELARLPLRLAKTELVERFERRYLARLLADCGGNVAEAARRAGVDRGTLFRSIRRHGIDVER